MLAFVVEGPPVPQPRPRVTRSGRVFSSGRVVEFKEAVVRAAIVAADEHRRRTGRAWDTGGVAYGIRLAFYKPTERHADWDNFAKAVCDALNRLLYADDSLIAEAHVLVRVDREHPRTEVELEVLA